MYKNQLIFNKKYRTREALICSTEQCKDNIFFGMVKKKCADIEKKCIFASLNYKRNN